MTPDELRTKQREAGARKGCSPPGSSNSSTTSPSRKPELEETRRRHEEDFELERRRHAQALAQMQQKLTQIEEQFAAAAGAAEAAHDQLLRTVSFRHAVGEAARLREALGADDSAMATIIAGAIGERTISETADSLNADRERGRSRRLRRRPSEQREWDARGALRAADRPRERPDGVRPGSRAAQDPGLGGRRRGEPRPGRPPERRVSHERAQERGQAAGGASANASRRETEQAERPCPTYSERQKRQARPKRTEAEAETETETDDSVIQAEVVSGGSSDLGVRGDAELEPREEDLGL